MRNEIVSTLGKTFKSCVPHNGHPPGSEFLVVGVLAQPADGETIQDPGIIYAPVSDTTEYFQERFSSLPAVLDM